MTLSLNSLDRNPLRRNPRMPAAAAAIKAWTRTALDIGDDVVISVNELACPLPDCPPRETVVLVLRTGAPAMRLSIHKAILEVVKQDVIEACAGGADLLYAKGAREQEP